MQKAMINFADSGRKNGLLLIDSPTASGKTFSAANFICHEYLRDPKQKIFYLTTLKANIQGFKEEVAKAFKEAGIKETIEDISLTLYSNFDCIINAFKNPNFETMIKGEEYKKFTNSQEYHALSKQVRTYFSVLSKQSYSADDLNLLEQFRKNVEDAENSFRKFLCNQIQELGSTPNARYNAIKRLYPALRILYPAIDTIKRSIFFMTIDKFYLGNNTIIEPPYKFISKDIIKNAIVIIDEIDSCKTSLLHQQIRESDRYKVDPVGLVKTIGAQLNVIKFRKSMLAMPSTSSEQEGKRKLTSKKCLDDIKHFVAETYKANRLEYATKLDESYQDKGAPFVFKDDGIFTINDGKGKEIYVDPDSTDNCNFIRSGKTVPEGKIPLMRYLLSVNNCVSSFVREVAVIANNYMDSQNEKRNDGTRERLDIASATSSVLSAFELSDNQIDSLSYAVASAAFDNKTGGKKGDLLYFDFYQEGFTFFGFKDELANDLKTKINLVQLKETPEYFLYRLASQSRVIGLSATCLIDSPISNFDLDYIASNLGDDYCSLTQEDRKRITDNFINNRQKDNKSPIRVFKCETGDNKFDSNEDIEKAAASLFKNSQLQQRLISEIFVKAMHSYPKKQLVKALLALKDFFLDPKVHSILLMRNNKLGTEEVDLYSKNTLEVFLKMVAEEHGMSDTTFTVISFNSANSKEAREKMQKAIREFDKVIVATTYPSAGVGQNLQFVCSHESDASISGEDSNDNKDTPDERDFDCIYLEKPTNIIVNIHPREQRLLETSDLLEAVYQFKAMEHAGELSRNQLMTAVKAAVRKTHFRTDGKEPKSSNYIMPGFYDKPSISKASLKVLNQAVGRICRTRIKPADGEIVIYYDEEIEKFDYSIFDGMLLNREFEELVKKLRKAPKVAPVEDYKTMKVETDCANIERHLNALFSETAVGWSVRRMSQWRDIRDFILRHPTVSEEEFSKLPPNYRHFYLSLGGDFSNRYWYQKLDANGEANAKLDSFEHLKLFYSKTSGAFEVSEDDCGLSKIARISVLNKAFADSGFATTFAPNKYIMNPIIYTNIYKGALGEVCGRKIFEESNIRLAEIEDGSKFEKYDFQVQGKEIYVDFKNWHLGTSFSEKDYLEKMEKKLDQVAGKLGIVVNLFHYDGTSIHDYGRILTISGLLNENPINGKYINKDAIKRIYKAIEADEYESDNK